MRNDLLMRRLRESLLLSACPLPKRTAPPDTTVDECMKRGECDCDAGETVRASDRRIRAADEKADYETEKREGWDY